MFRRRDRQRGAGGERAAGDRDPAHQDITIVTRFLVTATTSGTLTCRIYLRTASTSLFVARETVEGTLRFASLTVGGDVNQAAMQTSLPVGDIPVATTVRTPVLDRTASSAYRNVAVIADVEYHRCAANVSRPATYSDAHFTLTATSSGGAGCTSAPVAQRTERVPRGVNHAAIPLSTPSLPCSRAAHTSTQR